MVTAATSLFRQQRYQLISNNNNSKFRTGLALSSLLIMLIIDSQQQIASGLGISTVDAQQQQKQHNQQKIMIRKSAVGWLQTYKEPKNGEADNDDQGGRAGASRDERRDEAEGMMDQEEEQEEKQEELSCTIKVQKVVKYSGKCIRLHGGSSACQTDTYLDPNNEECMF